MIQSGMHGNYEWIVTDQNVDLLQVCPEIVIRKFVAITSFDSGPLVVTEDERVCGWGSRDGIAYSPRIEKIDNLPRDVYDEWYVFERPCDLGVSHLADNIFELPQERGHVSVFVNYGSFSLANPEALANLFWRQMEWICPESYIADGHLLNFVSSNKAVFARVRRALSSAT